MSSSYIDGTRIAFDITKDSLLKETEIAKILQKIKNSCGNDVPLSTHFIETQSASWTSVQEYDPFFENVVCVESISDFISKIAAGRVLSGLDVAVYILSKKRCTHLSLEKLVYFAYADYLCQYAARLFEDKIYAFIYGPVIKSVYDTYRKNGYKYLDPNTSNRLLQTSVKEMPAKSRILFAENGAEKLSSIDQTLKKYGHFTANELVDLTHREGSPWSRVGGVKEYQLISDELIMQYHSVECIEE